MCAAFSPHSSSSWCMDLTLHGMSPEPRKIARNGGCNHSTWFPNTHQLSIDNKGKFKCKTCLPYVGLGDFQVQINHHWKYPSHCSPLAPRTVKHTMTAYSHSMHQFHKLTLDQTTLCWEKRFWGADEPELDVSISLSSSDEPALKVSASFSSSDEPALEVHSV